MAERTIEGGPRELAPGVSFVARPEAAAGLGPPWRALAETAPTILVGVTGVGKSTALERLRARGLAYSLLPDRRLLADVVVIGTIQALDGRLPGPVEDRLTRLDYTARYRKLFGGGLAHALTRLVIDPSRLPSPLLFDGLRGREEVAYALDRLPGARFVVLEAPDELRVRRLLGRGDAFDRAVVAATGDDALAALRGLPGATERFDEPALTRLAALAAPGGVTVEALVRAAAIVIAERRNYDPVAAERYLAQYLGPERLLTIDTAADGAEAVAARIAAWL